MLNARRARLLEAATIVREVLAELDVKKADCDACGLPRYANFQDYRDSKILEGIAERLARLGNSRRGNRHAERTSP